MLASQFLKYLRSIISCTYKRWVDGQLGWGRWQAQHLVEWLSKAISQISSHRGLYQWRRPHRLFTHQLGLIDVFPKLHSSSIGCICLTGPWISHLEEQTWSYTSIAVLSVWKLNHECSCNIRYQFLCPHSQFSQAQSHNYCMWVDQGLTPVLQSIFTNGCNTVNSNKSGTHQVWSHKNNERKMPLSPTRYTITVFHTQL